jgi:hypothetical protein
MVPYSIAPILKALAQQGYGLPKARICLPPGQNVEGLELMMQDDTIRPYRRGQKRDVTPSSVVDRICGPIQQGHVEHNHEKYTIETAILEFYPPAYRRTDGKTLKIVLHPNRMSVTYVASKSKDLNHHGEKVVKAFKRWAWKRLEPERPAASASSKQA